MTAFKRMILSICSIVALLLFGACHYIQINGADSANSSGTSADISDTAQTDGETGSDENFTDTESESNGETDSVESGSDDNAENSGDDSLDNSSTDSDTSEDDSSLGSGTLVGDGVELPDVALP